jgi:hypothetical protein
MGYPLVGNSPRAPDSLAGSSLAQLCRCDVMESQTWLHLLKLPHAALAMVHPGEGTTEPKNQRQCSIDLKQRWWPCPSLPCVLCGPYNPHDANPFW